MVKNPPANAEDTGDAGLIPGSGRSPGGENSNPLQYSGLENSMDCIVHGVTKSQTRLRDFTFMHWRRKWQPTPVFLLGESQGRGSLVNGINLHFSIENIWYSFVDFFLNTNGIILLTLQ